MSLPPNPVATPSIIPAASGSTSTAVRPLASSTTTTTAVITQTTPQQPETGTGTLRLQGSIVSTSERRVQWDENVVDNEGMGKKSSKICCIYHKPRSFDESSSSESSSDEDDDPNRPNAYERQPKYGSRRSSKKKKGYRHHDHDHDHNRNHDHEHDQGGACGGGGCGSGSGSGPAPSCLLSGSSSSL
ncbi:Type 1 phosphatases regulator ypi1 [Quaeritorhiza haematococci]|nr:Type 1 phosphatases regulator ypi1 [Quaeritorhiza haematococci]